MTLVPIAFGVLTVVVLLGGLLAATSQNLVRSVLWLAVALVGTAALFALLEAPFLAGIQLILYTGGIITLMLFGVMLTDREHAVTRPNESMNPLAALMVAGLLFALLAQAIMGTDLPVHMQAMDSTTQALGFELLTEHLLAFEALSLLLLAAMVAAIVLARRKDPT